MYLVVQDNKELLRGFTIKIEKKEKSGKKKSKNNQDKFD
jgi:hypothetical protein